MQHEDDKMEEKSQDSGPEKYIIATVAMTCMSNLLMSRWIKDHTEADLDELVQAIEWRIRNADIEGLSYVQQEALIRRSVEHAHFYLDVYRKHLREKL
jgi:hypothetical protein